MKTYCNVIDALEADTSGRRGVLWMALGLGCVAAAGALRAWQAGTLKVDHAPIPLSAELVKAGLLGLGFCALCWGHLRLMDPSEGRAGGWRRRMAVTGLLHLAAAAALPLLSNDIFSNLNYGQIQVLEGINPYTASPAQLSGSRLAPWVSSYWKTTPAVYGPLLSGLNVLAVRLAGEGLVAGVLAFKALMLLVSLAAIPLAWLLCRDLADPGSRVAGFYLLAASPVWLVEVAGQAHNDGLMVVLLMAALLAHRRGRAWCTAGLLGLGIAAKYVAAVPLGLLMLRDLWLGPGPPWRRGLSVLGRLVLVGLVLVACYLPFWDGWQTLTRPLAALSAPRFAYSWLKFLHWATLPLGEPLMMVACRAAQGLLWLGLAALTWRWLRGWPTAGPAAPWATAGRFTMLHTMLINPHYLPWYLTWLPPLLAAEPDRRWWAVWLVHGYLSLFHYALELPFPGEEAVNTLLMQLLPLWMLLRMARGEPAVSGRGQGPLGRLARVAAS